ncbi:hypothetical protein [Paenibacillus sp. LHD-38]|uniref:hypothetical protein n=1 Tax=Paenibacillus sp. LHD-38 TaxID=3072143 RepID=UPI00280DAA26|nr:hypothetical protein [Paenibacillus sp. LHD-38]MDQ8739436.1 hypothetical protein [Paenibacillus sp. LHD-38]
MNMKKLVIFLLMFAGIFSSLPFAMANDDSDASVKFVQAIVRKENALAQKYLANGVTIPEIRENSPIKRYQLVTSPTENIKVFLGHFWDEVLGSERLAFIWELTFRDNKITQIRTIFDGANPLMDEVRLVKDYQNKYKRRVLIPTEFPFKVTHFDGQIESEEERLVLKYRSESLNGFLKVEIVPVSVELGKYKGAHDQV